MTAAERFQRLFRGLPRAYGVSLPTGKKDARGKMGARYATKRDALTEKDWQDHLDGKHCLVPIPIRDDGLTGFGAIDIDTYPLDLPALARKVKDLKMPLVLCRSKSGGAHLFLFLEEPYDAETIQSTLMTWAAGIGHPGVEIFPKQTSLASENDTGNGIAAPYRNAASSLEYALSEEGEPLSLEEFLDLAEASLQRGDALPEVNVETPEDMAEAPPCLQHWARSGVPEGQRNDVMFDFAIYAKKRWPDGWRNQFEEFNRRYGNPPLPAEEVIMIMKSVGKQKEYTYKAKCEGPYCNPAMCRKREHGRGGGYDDPGAVIDGLVILNTDPKTYIVSVDGRRIEMESSVLLDQRKFGLLALEKLDRLLQPVKRPIWLSMCRKLIDNAEHEEAPEDAGPRGQLMIHLQGFFDEQTGTDREQLRLDRAWRDVEADRTYFRSKDFFTYLKKCRVFGYKERDVFNAIRAAGGNADLIRVGETPLRVWWVPGFKKTEADMPPFPDFPEKDEVPF